MHRCSVHTGSIILYHTSCRLGSEEGVEMWRPIVDERGWEMSLDEPCQREKNVCETRTREALWRSFASYPTRRGEATGKGRQHSVRGAARIPAVLLCPTGAVSSTVVSSRILRTTDFVYVRYTSRCRQTEGDLAQTPAVLVPVLMVPMRLLLLLLYICCIPP